MNSISVDKLLTILFYAIFLTYPLGELGKISIMSTQPFALSTAVLLVFVSVYMLTILHTQSVFILPIAAILPLALLILLFLFDLSALPRSQDGFIEVFESLSAVLLFLVIVAVTYSKPRVTRRALQIMGAMLALGGIAALIHALGYPLWLETKKPITIAGFHFPLQRSTGFPMDYGLYGIMNISILPLALLSIVMMRGLYRSRIIGFLVSASLLLAVIISQDLSMWLATTMALTVLLLGCVHNMRKKYPMIYLSALCGVILLGILGAVEGSQIMQLFYEANEGSILQRMHQYETAIRLIQVHPFTGIGYNQFENIYNPIIFPWNPDPSLMLHSYFLSKAVSTGIISALILIVLFTWVAFRLWYGYRKFPDGHGRMFMLGLLSAFIGMMVELAFYPGGSGLKIIWVYVGIAWVGLGKLRVICE